MSDTEKQGSVCNYSGKKITNLDKEKRVKMQLMIMFLFIFVYLLGLLFNLVMKARGE